MESNDFVSSKAYANILNPSFEPTNVLMITYDNVSPFDLANVESSRVSRVSFQIYLLADSLTSFVIFKYKSCPSDITLLSLSGLNHRNNANNLDEINIIDGQLCTFSNVKQTGVWVSEVTVSAKGKLCDVK